MTKILVLHGPNLNLLGTREPDRYGGHTLEAIRDRLQALATAEAVRLLFFQSLFEKFTVEWQETRSRRESGLNEGGIYHLCIGAYKARDREQLAQYLEFLGSRLVFLIDWNRARKRLRPFVRKRSGIAVLKWAADNGYGHMAYLKVGGDMLIYDAMQFAIKGAPRFGEDLRDMLGRERALAFLKFVVRTCAEASWWANTMGSRTTTAGARSVGSHPNCTA